MNVRLYFEAKMVTSCINHIGNRKILLKHHSPARVPANPFAHKCVLISEKQVGTQGPKM